jgi:hydrogenase-1 operon protein HyaF
MSDSLFGAIGAGSQPAEEDVVLEYMQLPSGMMTYHMPSLPEPEVISGTDAAMAALNEVLAALENFKNGQPAYTVDITGLDHKCRAFIDEALGDGEVSIVGANRLQAMESVLAGVWRVRVMADDGGLARDVIEIGHLPNHINDIAFADARLGVRPPEGVSPEGLLASPSLLAEIHNVLTGPEGATATHSINLSLLRIRKRTSHFSIGISARAAFTSFRADTQLPNRAPDAQCLRVRYYNSQDTLIPNSLEVALISVWPLRPLRTFTTAPTLGGNSGCLPVTANFFMVFWGRPIEDRRGNAVRMQDLLVVHDPRGRRNASAGGWHRQPRRIERPIVRATSDFMVLERSWDTVSHCP